MFEKIHNLVTQIKQQKPIVLNITNTVTMDFIANGLLSLGASPIMSQAMQEAENLLTLAHVVVINIGTLNKEFVSLSEHVCKIANQLQKPIILDPVGAGASRFRTEACLKLIEDHAISIIRGNASEVMALANLQHATKGVDSHTESRHAIESAVTLSKQYNLTVVVSGKTDFIIEGDKQNQCERGSYYMPLVTGAGCLLSAVVGAFHAVCSDRFDAASAATQFYGMCGEYAEEKADGPASFKTQFIDALYKLPERGRYEN